MWNTVSHIFYKYSFLNNEKIIKNVEKEPYIRDDFPNWNKWKFFITGVFLFPIKMNLIVFFILNCFFWLKILILIFWVKDLSKPQSSLFIKLSKFILRFSTRGILFSWGYFWINKKKQKANPDNVNYFNEMDEVPYATIIANHTSLVDINLMLSLEKQICFISNHQVKKYPVIGIIAEIIQCIFVDRRDKESRLKTFDLMKERIENIKQNPKSKFNKRI